MKFGGFLLSLGAGLAIAVTPAFATWPTYRTPSYSCPPSYYGPAYQYAPSTTTMPAPDGTPRPSTDSTVPSDLSAAPETSAFTPGGDTALASAAASATPQMLGDFVGYSVVRVVSGGSFSTESMEMLPDETIIAVTPIAARAGFKIAENESPRPVDRVFFGFNHFDDVNASRNRGLEGLDIYREIFGFEKTFWGGDASVTVRIPLVHQTGLVDDTTFGDVSVVTKFALINDCCTGNVVSGGIVFTAPTGDSVVSVFGNDTDSWLIQPWGGFIHNLSDDIYTHGFSSIVIPTDGDEISLWFNSLGIGYWMYRSHGCCDSWVQGVAPTMEIHITTPLDDDDAAEAGFYAPDQVVLTNGAHLMLSDSTTLTLGLAFPITGPNTFDWEGILQLNMRY